VGRLGAAQAQTLVEVRRLAHDFDIGLLLQDVEQTLTDERIIVHDQDPDGSQRHKRYLPGGGMPDSSESALRRRLFGRLAIGTEKLLQQASFKAMLPDFRRKRRTKVLWRVVPVAPAGGHCRCGTPLPARLSGGHSPRGAVRAPCRRSPFGRGRGFVVSSIGGCATGEAGNGPHPGVRMDFRRSPGAPDRARRPSSAAERRGRTGLTRTRPSP